jgi:hypothetical protein
MGVLTAQSPERRPRPRGPTPSTYVRVEFSVPRPQISLRGVRVHQDVARQIRCWRSGGAATASPRATCIKRTACSALACTSSTQVSLALAVSSPDVRRLALPLCAICASRTSRGSRDCFPCSAAARRSAVQRGGRWPRSPPRLPWLRLVAARRRWRAGRLTASGATQTRTGSTLTVKRQDCLSGTRRAPARLD